MNNISIENVEFFQDEEKGKTVAVYSGCELDAFADFKDRLDKITSDSLMVEFDTVPEEVILPSKIKAISTCHFPDKWDPEKGKNQAYYKLLRSYNKMKLRAVNRLIKFFNRELNAAEDLVSYYKRSQVRLTNVIKNPPEVKKK